MSAQDLQGVVEDAPPRQIGPGNAPGPPEPVVIGRVEAARQLRAELHERYPGVRFSVTTDHPLYGYPGMTVDYTDGPLEDEVEAVAQRYIGYVRTGSAQYDDFTHDPRTAAGSEGWRAVCALRHRAHPRLP